MAQSWTRASASVNACVCLCVCAMPCPRQLVGRRTLTDNVRFQSQANPRSIFGEKKM